MLIQRAVLLDGTAMNIRVDEQIAAVGELEPRKGEEVFDAAGATVMTGAIVWLALAGLWGVARWMKKSRRLKSPD